MFACMDLHLPLLADVNFHVGIAEEAVSERAWGTARNNLEKAEASFEELRQLWPDMRANEQGLLGAMVKPLKTRYDLALAHIPTLAVISQGIVEPDAEEDTPPPE